MSLLVSTAVNDVGQELNLIGQQLDPSDIFLYLTRAVNYFSSTYALPTAKKTQDILFFPGVREYQLNSDVGSIIEPQRSPFFHSPRFQHETSRELSHWPYGNLTALEYDGATPYLVANVDGGSLFLVESCDSTDDLVSVTGDASTATLDQLIFTQGIGSLRFTITASGGTTTITFSVDTFDITEMLKNNYAFLDLGVPATNTADVTSVSLRIGNDSSNYYTMSATTRYRGQDIGPGFGLIGFDLTSATEVGSVTDTAIDYVAVIITTPLSGVNGVYHLDNIFLSQGTLYDLPYYSSNNILDQNGVPTNTVTSTGDTILLPLECNEAIIYKTLELAASSPNIANTNFANYAARELKSKEDNVRATYPLQRSMVQSQWYKRKNFKSRSIQRWI